MPERVDVYHMCPRCLKVWVNNRIVDKCTECLSWGLTSPNRKVCDHRRGNMVMERFMLVLNDINVAAW